MARYICESCMNMLASLSVHDFVRCPGRDGKPCENDTFVDGGNEYNRYGGKDIRKITVLDYVQHGTKQVREEDLKPKSMYSERWPY